MKDRGNNYSVTKFLVAEIEKLNLNLDSASRWFSMNSKIFSSLFEKYKFTKINVPFRIDLKQTKDIVLNLKILNLEYKEIEEEQNKNGLLTNSEMDLLIYKYYDDYTSFAVFLYGDISEREVENKRELIQASIEFYKQQNKKGLI